MMKNKKIAGLKDGDEIFSQNDSPQTEKKKRLTVERHRAIKKKLFYGCGAIVICFVLILGIMFGATNAEEKIRIILLIVFCSMLGASLLSYILVVLVKDRIDVQQSDPDYMLKRQEKLKEKKSIRQTKKRKNK